MALPGFLFGHTRFLNKIWWRWPATATRFFIHQIGFFSTYLASSWSSHKKPSPQQANPCPCGCSFGVLNNPNYTLISIFEQLLPQGLKAWRNIAVLYQNASNESKLCRGGAFVTIGWGSCVKTSRSRQVSHATILTKCTKANAAILGASSANKSDHNNNQESMEH